MRTWLLPSSGVVLQRCDLRGFVWELCWFALNTLKSNVLWIKQTNFAFLLYSLLFHGIWRVTQHCHVCVHFICIFPLVLRLGCLWSYILASGFMCAAPRRDLELKVEWCWQHFGRFWNNYSLRAWCSPRLSFSLFNLILASSNLTSSRKVSKATKGWTGGSQSDLTWKGWGSLLFLWNMYLRCLHRVLRARALMMRAYYK